MGERKETRRLSREEVAKIEIGRTTIRRPVAWGLIATFLATVYAVPVGQHVYEIRAGLADRARVQLPRCYDIFGAIPRTWRAVRSAGEAPLLWRVKRANDEVLLREIDEYTDAIKRDSLLSDLLLPPAQRLMARGLGVGTEQAYVGRDDWLFYRPDVDYVTGPGFLSPRHVWRRQRARKEWQRPPGVDPVSAIGRFARQLRRRGIRLIVVPTPVKPMIHPEKLSGRFDGCREVLQNPSYRRFVRRLEDEAGEVLLFDASGDMMSRKLSEHPPRQLYLRADTHWLPETMDFVAERLAAVVRRELAQPSPATQAATEVYREEARQVTNVGDVAVMLQPLAQSGFARSIHGVFGGAADWLATDRRNLLPKETVTIRRVLTAEGRPWQPDRNGDVLLLGDSFSNVYSDGRMGWGDSAGLAERLSFHLRRPVDAIRRNDDGAYATRKLLDDDLRAGRNRLAGKKVVVWQFAIRELSVGDWRNYAVKLGPAAKARDVLELPAGRQAVVTGRIAALTRPPRPGTVPYKDFIMAVHLRDVRDAQRTVRGAEAVVFLWGMRDRKWTRNARLRIGQEITVRLRPWQEVVRKYGTVRRGEIDDVDIDVNSFWCEEIR